MTENGLVKIALNWESGRLPIGFETLNTKSLAFCSCEIGRMLPVHPEV
jgi:hypothetical protein